MEELIKEYVKENNIKSYINIEDIQNIFQKLTDKQIQEIESNYEDDYTFEDIAYEIVSDYNYRLAVENEDTNKLVDYIMGCEFDIKINKESKIDLIDLQGAYLGGGETYENFDTIMEANGRLEGSFYRDYYGIEVY